MRTVQKKICLLGDFAVGKTSLVRQFVEGRFDDKYLSTIGVKISRKTLKRDEYVLNLLIWDLAGGDDYSTAGVSYLHGAVGALIVCDLSRPETMDAVHEYAQQLTDVNPEAVFIALGNKVDLVEQTAKSEEMLQTEMSSITPDCLLTSAKTGQNVEAAFLRLADLVEAKS